MFHRARRPPKHRRRTLNLTHARVSLQQAAHCARMPSLVVSTEGLDASIASLVSLCSSQQQALASLQQRVAALEAGAAALPAGGAGTSALDAAAFVDSCDAIDLLLSRLAPADRDRLLHRGGPGGRTCLMIAAAKGHAAAADRLVRAGGARLVVRRNLEGRSAADEARVAGWAPLARALARCLQETPAAGDE